MRARAGRRRERAAARGARRARRRGAGAHPCVSRRCERCRGDGAAAAAIEAAIGPLDLAVLNAGTYHAGSRSTGSTSPSPPLMEINYMGAVNGIAAVLPRFLARASGHFAVVAVGRGLSRPAAGGGLWADQGRAHQSVRGAEARSRPARRQDQRRQSRLRAHAAHRPQPIPDAVPDGAEVAARRIAAGSTRGKFEITFPRRFTFMLKLARMLPYGLYFRLVKRTTGR